MLQSFVCNLWTAILFFFLVVLPIIFIFGVMKNVSEMNKEKLEEAMKKAAKKADKHQSPKEEEPAYTPPIETYRTVKKEPGSYSVVGPGKKEAIVIRVETPHDGKYWIAILADKEGKKSERVKTKKEAVELAIELLKEKRR